MSWLERLETKDLTINRIGEDGFIPADLSYGGVPRSNYAYDRAIRQGLDSNVVMAPVFWIMRNFTEAEAVVERRTKGLWEKVIDHDLTALLARPNPYYGGDTLWKATLASYEIDGNAYWQKVRNTFGEVIGLWYLPHFLVEPKWSKDGSEFISHYEYHPAGTGREIKLPNRDVVHLRFGLDPRNTRKGLSPLKPLLREVFTDEEASNFSASILRNMGVPGGVISPKDASSLPDAGDVKEMKEYMKSGFSGDRRGDWLVLGTPTETSQFGFNPQNLMLGNLRDIAEERVCAVLGIPAAVVGFGAGLQQTKVGATMRELRQSAWHNCVIPQQSSISEQITMQVMPDFVSQVRRFRVAFDRSQVSVFQEEETERARRVGLLVEKGVLRVDKGQEMLGMEVDPEQAVYLRPTSSTAVPATEEAAESMVQTPSENGTGGDGAEEEDESEEIQNRAAAAIAAQNGGG